MDRLPCGLADWRALFACACASLWLAANPAHAAEPSTTPIAFCGAAASSEGLAGQPAIPADLLAQTTSTVEANLAMAGDPIVAADHAIALIASALRPYPASAGGLSPDVMAAFCTAAGEAYRLGKGGSPLQARLLLGLAYRLAGNAHRDDLAALAAYRLGLVAMDGATAGSRGARRAMLRSPDAPQQQEGEKTGSCGLISGPAALMPQGALASVNALSCAIATARSAQALETGAKASLRLARYWLDHGRRTPADQQHSLREAAKVSLNALGDAARISQPVLRAEMVGRLAEAALDTGLATQDPRLRAAIAQLDRDGADGPSRAQAGALKARLTLADGDAVTARTLLRQAIMLESGSALPMRLPDWYLLLAQADPVGRSAHLTAAFRALNAVRPLLPRFDAATAQSNFTLRVQPVFEALLADRLADGAGDPDDPLRIAEAQGLVEEYRQAELQSVFGSECVAARAPIRPAELHEHEVLLYPVLLPDRVLLIYAVGGVSGDGAAPRYHLLAQKPGVGRSDVIGLANAMTDSVSYGGDDSWRAPARRLYDILVAPVADKLGPDGTLVVIPDGPLSALPFAALLDERQHFLIERATVGTVPSLAYSQPGAPLRAQQAGVVAASLAKEVILPVGTFPALAGTGEEARFAVVGLKHGQLIENFHRADLVHALAARQTDVLHLATHASFNGRSDRSYIVADGEQIPIADLRNLIAQNQARGEQLDLLVLSACETAVGDDQASLGLAGAAVQSGARSVLASLWQVNDAGTAQLMKAFYQGLAAGKGKAAALRDAQRQLIAQGFELADPGVWSAFILLGAWR
ncbi:CHAT domain-containing protein [Novosphingobium cyanobacteriorum]|uniref:CHAT domain-containing protein n=1 Tax=Novosphingobium cyanobacteriorum TaxID=3024215 RepID=A0ABT6CKI5_9SPHN|nr:CHAT domain-containing protein [Novosphingobium cyanobacteriorum]MDF8334347.1 CHAT domain-containing protein [Novosphingobium cyanobacteriorum]